MMHDATRVLMRALVVGALVLARAVHAQGDATVEGLPLKWTAPIGASSRYAAVLLTGDGGYADLLDRKSVV